MLSPLREGKPIRNRKCTQVGAIEEEHMWSSKSREAGRRQHCLLALVIVAALAIIGCDSKKESSEDKEFADVLRLANSGDAEAQIKAAERLFDGKGIAKDEQLALSLYEKAASQGNVSAQLKLGKIYQKGLGIKKNFARAFDYYQKAAVTGSPEAKFELGNMYAFGLGTTVDAKKALELLEAAWESGVARSAGIIGYVYEGAWGVTRDTKKAVEWYEKGVAKDNELALVLLGVAYLNGEIVHKDTAKALNLLQRAADKGDAGAHFAIGSMYRDGNGVTKDDSKAVAWFEKAVALGHEAAKTSLGYAYYSGEGVPKNAAKAAEMYLLAAVAGDGEAQRMYGWMSFQGQGIPQNKVIGYAWTNIAAAKGVRLAIENRQRFESELTPQEISEAQRISSGWSDGMALTQSIQSDPQATSGRVHAFGLTKQGAGTAFVVSKLGQAVTNYHVIQGCTEVRLEGRDGVVKVKSSDVVNDLALLTLPGPTDSAAPILAEPSKLRQGDEVAVFGFPLNTMLSSGGNLTPGVVSALTGLGNNTNQIQITAPIQPGSSGSPVLNRRGQVVGVVAMKISDVKMARTTGQVAQNVNFAVGGQTLKDFLTSQQVDFSTGYFRIFDKSNADLADEARKWTLVVECWR